VNAVEGESKEEEEGAEIVGESKVELDSEGGDRSAGESLILRRRVAIVRGERGSREGERKLITFEKARFSKSFSQGSRRE